MHSLPENARHNSTVQICGNAVGNTNEHRQHFQRPANQAELKVTAAGAYMQAASIDTSPSIAQYHSGLALKLIVIFFCVSPSLNE